MSATARHEAMLAAVQGYVNDHEGGGLVTGVVLTIEVARPDGGQMLMHRTVDAEAHSLTSWRQLGLIHSTLLDAEDYSRDGRTPAEDPEP